MKKTFLILVVISSVVLSCKRGENAIVVKDDSTTSKEETTLRECYDYTNGKDTIQAKIIIQSGKVTGDLTYQLFEKDSNTGTIVGSVKGDTLLAEYTFMSEGTSSNREVVFLRKGNKLIEGYGDMEENDGVMAFKDKSLLNFDGKTILNLKPCR